MKLWTFDFILIYAFFFLEKIIKMNVKNTCKTKSTDPYDKTKKNWYIFQIQKYSCLSLIQINQLKCTYLHLLSFRLSMKTANDFAMIQNSSELQKHVDFLHLCSTIRLLALHLLLFLHLTLRYIHLSLSPLSLIEYIPIQKTSKKIQDKEQV